MIAYSRIPKAERAHILESQLASMRRDQGMQVQDSAIVLMQKLDIDYTEALEILMEFGASFSRLERNGLLKL